MSTGSNHDYTRDDAYAAATAAPADFDDYSFAPVPVAGRDAEEIERDAESREFRQIEPGDHELIVTGLYKAPEDVMRTGYLRGVHVSWVSKKIGVRLAKASDLQATLLDFFDLPPVNPADIDAYLNASSKPEGKNPGFLSEKFGHFIARLGWPYPKGAPLPAEACNIKNWKGRRIHATVEVQRDNPARNQVKLFSYRPASPAGGSTPMPAATVPPSHARQATPPAQTSGPAGRGALAATGLDDL